MRSKITSSQVRTRTRPPVWDQGGLPYPWKETGAKQWSPPELPFPWSCVPREAEEADVAMEPGPGPRWPRFCLELSCHQRQPQRELGVADIRFGSEVRLLGQSGGNGTAREEGRDGQRRRKNAQWNTARSSSSSSRTCRRQKDARKDGQQNRQPGEAFQRYEKK